jgi:hypothetical protein
MLCREPFKQLWSPAWSAGDGVAAEIVFTGDVFETEDQRNWTDQTKNPF